jgi:antitoxin component of MazEF toxin-antitoxin module
MAREILKVRRVGGTLVVTLTQAVLEQVKVEEGDRVLVEALPPKRILISKEEPVVQGTRRVELELEALEAKQKAVESDLAYKHYQHTSGMPCEVGLDNDSIAELAFHQLRTERDRLGAKIARKRLELFNLQGA